MFLGLLHIITKQGGAGMSDQMSQLLCQEWKKNYMHLDNNYSAAKNVRIISRSNYFHKKIFWHITEIW